MKEFIVAGIDPGFGGAIAFLYNRRFIEAVDMPILDDGKSKEVDLLALRDLLSKYKVDKIYLEKAQPMTKGKKGQKGQTQGIASTGKYMMNFGMIRGLLTGMRIPYTLIAPVTWKKVMMRDMNKEKQASIIRVQQLYPGIHLPRKKDHGKADAILIARFGYDRDTK